MGETNSSLDNENTSFVGKLSSSSNVDPTLNLLFSQSVRYLFILKLSINSF